MWDWFLSGLTIKVEFLLLWFAVFDFRLCRLCHFGSRHYCWPNLVWMYSVCRWCLTSLMVACPLRPMTSWVILHSKSSPPAFKTKKIVWKSKILELVNVVRCYTINIFSESNLNLMHRNQLCMNESSMIIHSPLTFEKSTRWSRNLISHCSLESIDVFPAANSKLFA